MSFEPARAPATLVELLRERGQREAAGGYGFLDDAGAVTAELSFPELDRRARAIAAVLGRAGAPGDRVLLLYASGLDYVEAFYACLYAGRVAVPVYPPGSDRTLPRLRAVVEDARPSLVLTMSRLRERVEDASRHIAALRALPVLATDSIDGAEADGWREPRVTGETEAFLQYTSGSTQTPRGVVLRHRHLLDNERAIRRAFGQSAESVVVSWLPLYHDMGLIGGVLQPLYVGGRCLLMSPVSFLQKPVRWLEAIDRYRATTSGGPNFAYDLCVRKIPEAARSGLDLSAWRVAFNGAEPVRAETLRRFAEAFSGSGFRAEAFFPCYGLAEATLFVTGRGPEEPVRIETFTAADLERGRATPAVAAEPNDDDPAVRALVSSGRPADETRVVVADPETGRLRRDGEVGEIWVSGPGVASGYHGRPEATRDVFGARLAGGHDTERDTAFLRTGDLGFRWHEELFVTGRLKDLIILRGRNLAPQDIELSAAGSHPAFRPGGSAAFSIDSEGEERLVVLQEIEPREVRGLDGEEAAAAVRGAIAGTYSAQVHDVVLLRAGGIPRTSSGKIQRRASRQAYLDGSLPVLGRFRLTTEPPVAPPAEMAADATGFEGLADRIRARIRELGGEAPAPGERRSLPEMGLDSLAIAQLGHALEEEVGGSPTLAELYGATGVEDVAERLAARLATNTGEAAVPEAGPAAAEIERPVTPDQEALWLLDRRSPESGVSHIGGAVRAMVPLDAARLECAVSALTRRHPALRTLFRADGERVWQRVSDAVDGDLEVMEVGSLTADDLKRRIEGWIARPFDLENGPPLRVALWRCTDVDVLSLAVHHVVADLWSLTVIARDLGVLYRRNGEARDLPRLAATPFDVFRDREHRCEGTAGERLRHYWQERLTDPPAALELPTDRSRPRVPVHDAGRALVVLSETDTLGVDQLARDRGTTRFVVLLAVVDAWLHRITGEEDLILGSPFSGRTDSRSASLVGYFVRMLPLRVDVSGDPRFEDVVDRAGSSFLEALRHQDLPMALLDGDHEGVAPFRVVLALQRTHLPGTEGLAACVLGRDGVLLEAGGLAMESVGLAAAPAQFDLTLIAAEIEGRLALSVEYAAALFDRATVERFAAGLERVLRGVVMDPSPRIGDLPLLDEAERRQLRDWSRRPVLPEADVEAGDESIPRQVAAQARRRPEALAVRDGGMDLTYGGLAAAAHRMAERLARAGVGPESRVATCLPRSADLLVAQLGALFAGAAYLALDPAQPDSRLSDVLADAGACALVVSGSRPGLRAPEDCAVIDAAAVRAESGSLPEPLSVARPITSHSLAYMIYTSGSTGRPKGVAIPHAGLENLVRWHRSAYQVTEDDRMALVASPGFDASVWEIWPVLASGASLHVVDDDLRASPSRLVHWLAKNDISLCFLPTALAEDVLAEPWPSDGSIRVILTGGDRLVARPRPDAGFRLFNHYGPTEGTVVTTVAEVEAGEEGSPPIGWPIPGLSIWVTDRGLRPVPPGVSGELTIGGEGLARGYWGRAAVTAEAFVPDPFVKGPGARRYRTGDRVRHGADGALAFLGRLDRQFQVRGVRIEPGEIEAALVAHPDVAQAVVAVRRFDAGDRLVAYLTGPGDRPESSVLRRWLARRLPAAMVPSVFVFLDALPQTIGGKIDRASLAEVRLPDASPSTGEAPRTPVERRLADLWNEVLGEPVVGRETDFFAAGGDSLRAARMLGRVRRELDVEVPLTAIFEEPTLAALARRIEAASAGGAAEPARLLSDAGRGSRRDFPLSFAQERLWLHDRLDPGAPAYNIPGAWRLLGDLDVAALAASLDALLQRHAILRTSFHAAGDIGPVQRIGAGAVLPLPRIDLSRLPVARRETELLALVEAEGAHRFDLERPPLVRTRLVVLGEREHVLSVTMHHIVADGTSASLIEHELEDFYAAFTQSRPPSRTDPPVQYADYAVWQRSLRGDVLASRVVAAVDRLAGVPASLELPADRLPQPRRTRRGDQVPVAVPAETAEAVRRLARRSGATAFMTLLAAFATWLHRASGEDDLVVGTPVDVRDRPETEALVGCFVNLLPVRIDLSGDPTFTELLARVRRSAMEAYQHRDVPFEKLVEASRVERVAGALPLVQVVLSLDPKPRELRLPGLEVVPVSVRRGAAKFDLSFVLADGADRFDGYLEYDGELFDRSTAEEIAGRILQGVAEAAADPDRRVSDLAGLDARERAMVLLEWSVGKRLVSPSRGVYERIADQARRAPHALALAQGETRWTFGDLVRGALRLAVSLLRRGVGPERRVGVLASSGPDRVLGQLAVLAAGGAYLPLDPAYPDARLAEILEDAKAVALLAEPGLADRLMDMGVVAIPSLPLVLDAAADEEASDEVPAEVPQPDALAYVVFTSGSTGRPKGVAVPHRGLDNLVAWHLDVYRLTPDDRASQLAAPGFDAAVWEVWPSLAAGASVHWPVDDEVRASGERIAEWITAEKVTVSFLPTPLVEEMLARVDADHLARMPLRILLTGGDRLRRRPPANLPWRLVNHYGPTESSVVTTASVVSPDGTGAPVIGRPIANLRTYVVDRAGTPALPGTAGEMRIGGPGLARGYLGRPGETAEAFVPDAFGDRPGGRLYRTGDRIRFDRRGDLEFVGRIDHQVKVRGFRIEPGEVESALTGIPGVSEAVVVARKGGAGDARLLGYFVLTAPGSCTEDDLVRSLRERLPPFMVPSRLVELPELPLTRHGKVDRRALPEPEGSENAGTAPRTPTEELLTSVWSEVLEVDRVGVHQNFFALGGHSLLGSRLVTRVRDVLDVNLDLRTLFENPTIAELGRRIDETSATGRSRSAEGPPLVLRGGSEDAPLSYSQERLWFLSQLDEAGSAFNISGRVELAGDLHATAMEETLRRVIARQESLRTTFAAERGRPFQRIHPAGAWNLPRIDLQGLEPGSRAAEVERVRGLQAKRSFDLERGPLMLVWLVRLEDRLHHLDITLHHIIADGWSMDVLVRETMAHYRALVGEDAVSAALPPAPAIQYADYAAWQRRWLQNERLERLLGYWRERFADTPPPLELPTDRPRPQVPSFQGDRVVVRMAGDLEAAIADACREGAVTRHMVVLTAFTALLHRYTGERDLCVGTFVANRNRPEVESLIGFFVNNLALRIAVDPDGGWRDLSTAVRDVTLGAYDHQDLPFERLLSELKIERGIDWTPLFRVMCVHQNMPRTTFELPGLDARPRPGAFDSARFDLTLWLEEDDGLEAALDYSTDLFDRATAERLLGHFATLLSAGLRNPATPVSGLDLLTPGEREQLTAWNRTDSSWSIPESPIREIAEWARREPDRVAVTDGTRSLTYGGLQREATRLAGYLVAHGVGPEAVVGICIERSIEMIVALLAVLEAGGGYLPLDPNYPRARLAFMLDDSPVTLLITRSGLAAALPRLEVPIVEIDRERGAIAAFPDEPPPDRADANCLAYLVYTSGSTGRPKAVVVSRGALANHTRSAADAYELSADDRALQFASINFDASAEEIYPTLNRGGTLILRSEEMLRTPETFLERCGAFGVTILNLPTAYWHTLAAAVESGSAALPTSVRVVIIGGERALAARMEEWRRRVSADSRLVNTYGPTEATVVATRADVGGGGAEAAPSGVVPIGRPISNLRAIVLDARGWELPVGVPGELVLGGAGIARGYLGRPGLTAERFIPGPADGRRPDRLYRTGDLVVRRSDGGMEFIGRTDDQVKIRGYRVELGEVASRLAQHPAIRDAAAIAWEPEPGRRQLVAYATAAPDAAEPTVSELRAFLRERLPDYMVPSSFVLLDELPRNAAGKLDRAGLPEPEGVRPELQDDFVPPGSPAEEVLASIWGELLGVGAVGIHDDFFELGGYSLLATQVIARASEALGTELSLASFFEAPTVAEQARQVESSRQDALPPIEPVARDGDLPLSFAQERIWFLTQLRPDDTSYHVPRGLRITGTLRLDALVHAYSGVTTRHEILRTAFPAVDGLPVQRILSPRRFDIPLIDLRGLAPGRRDEEVRRRTLELGNQLFDFERGPMIRAAVFRLAPELHFFYQVEHHLVHDGWAEGVLLRDLLEYYTAFVEGRPARLPTMSIQFADLSAWQRRWMAGEVMERQLEYWRRELAGAPALLALPTDRPRPEVRSGTGEEHVLMLSAERVDRIRSLTRQVDATLFMAMKSAFDTILYRYSGQRDFVVGTTIANRRHRTAEGLLGMVVNTVPLRTRLEPESGFRHLVAVVRESCLGAYAHQDMPFEKLVEAVRPHRKLEQNPLFQVAFGFHDAPHPEMHLPGADVEYVQVHNRSSKFDMAAIVVPTDDEMVLLMEHSEDLFDSTTIFRMRRQFLRVLDQAAEDPDRRLVDFALLEPSETQQVLVEWNDARNRAYVVDPFLRAQPVGVPGDVMTGGPGVDRSGDFGAREVAERWIPDFLTGELGARLYRTGATARRAPDGTLRRGLPGVGGAAPSVLGETIAVDSLLPALGSGFARSLGAWDVWDPVEETERRQLLHDLQGRRADYPVVSTHQLIARRIEASPGAIAVTAGSSALSYQELGRRARRLARRLRRLGAGPDRVVALYLDRGLDMAVALLAVLEAGAAYVPIDPELPARRVHAMLASCQPVVVVTSQDLGDLLPSAEGPVPTRVLASEAATSSGPDDEASVPLPVDLDPEQLAYVLFTSGSSGEPKGVMVTHRALSNHMLWMDEDHPLDADDRVLQRTSYAFDASVWEIFYPWIAGARLVLARPGGQRDVHYLLETVERERVTVLPGVPTLLRQLAADPALARCVSIRLVYTGAEPLAPDLVRTLDERLGRPVVNFYGPTETTIEVTSHVCSPDGGSVPIGRPIANCATHVLDPRMRLLPRGALGELYVGGPPVARGYWGRPAETARSFVPDPLSEVPGARLYATGDLVRWRADGTLESFGRRDFQVKVRGHRVELEAVEAALRGHPAVREAAAAVRRGIDKVDTLIGYVVLVDGARMSSEVLRRDLRNTLPDAMVPDRFVPLPSLPLLPSGKVDRRALPDPEVAGLESDRFEPPATVIEEVLASVWRDLLGREHIGAHDDFFALGGHSLLATRVTARLREAFGIDLPVRELFDAPTLRGLATAIARIREGEVEPAPPLRPSPSDHPVPLSFAQERLWFLDRLEPDSPAYNVASSVRLDGPLAAGVLYRVFAEVTRRHATLRTRFPEIGGEPVQEIGGPGPALAVVDLQELAAERRDEVARSIASRLARLPFDLRRGPVARVILARLEPEVHFLVLVLHHIVSDGWSMQVLVRELTALYAAYRRGQPSPLSALPVQYSDYARWQRRWMGEERIARELGYWREQLDGVAPLLDFATDRPRPAVPTYRCDDVPVEIDAGTTRALRRLAREEIATLHMVLLAGFQLLLARRSGVSDVVVGAPIAGRHRPEVEDLIGLFVNTLALRTDLSGAPGFRELLTRARQVALEAHQHQEIPFERLVQELHPERDLGHSPIFQVMLTFQDAEPPELRRAADRIESDLRAVPVPTRTGVAQFDLELVLRLEADRVVGALRYNIDLFDRTTALRMVDGFRRLMAGVVEDPELPVWDVGMLSDAEHWQLLGEWNDTAIPIPRQGGFLEVFARTVEANPDAIALACDDATVSYRGLDRWTAAVAARLAAAGAGPESVVAILTERGLGYWIAALGALRTGAAFLPLDPQHPAARIRQVLGASGSVLVVAAEENAPVLYEALGGPPPLLPLPRMLFLERTLSRDPLDTPDGAIVPAVPESALAYVIFTSGSTGAPKGAMVTHLGMINHLWAKRVDLALEAADCVAQTASQCFDISVWQLLLPLAVGGRAEIFTDAVSHAPALLLSAVTRRRVTVLETVPSILGVLLEEDAADRARGKDVGANPLRWMIPTGEALPPELVRLWLRHHPEVPLLNAYGPTECSDDVSHAPIGEAPGSATRRMTIGRPVANTGLAILDARLHAVPRGVTGELCVRGLGVGRGYLRDPKRTAEVFVPDPQSDRRGGRLYRTGDLAAWRSDGNVDFLGRRDHQVKVRGFRIELGEIESVLHDCAGVRDAVVVTGQVGGRVTELIAYAAPLAGHELSAEALKIELRRALPDYMVPARWVLMDALPLLPSGKVDRRALPAPDVAGDRQRLQAPRGLTEELVAGIWSALLGIDRLGIHEDFFEIGGHSLVATRVIARIRQAFGIEVPLQDLFREPTIAALAERIDRARSVGVPARPPVERRPRDGEIPLSFAQQRLWLIDQLQPGLTAYNIAEALEIGGALDVPVLTRALGEVIRRHEALRTTFSLGSDGPVQIVAPTPPAGAAMEMPVVDLEHLAGATALATARELALRHAAWPFDLAAGPLFRCLLARLAPDRHVLYLAMHHVVGDGASDEVLVRELVPLYRAFAAGRPSPLPELPVQYPDFTLWQREWLTEEVLADHVGYWRRKLSGLPASLEMPFDRPRPPIQTFGGASHRFVLGEDLASAVVDTSRRRSVTPYMLVLATFAALLARYSGQRDLAFGTPISGRDQVELEGMVGFFVNTLVMRIGAAPEDRFSDLLTRTRDTVIEAQAHQALPFERLVEELRPVRRLEHSPLFQAMVNYAVVEPRPPVPDLDLRPLEVETRTSQFDLTLAIAQVGGVLRGSLTYATDLFDATTAQRLVRGFRTALAAATADPEGTLGELPLISKAERHQVTWEWSDTAIDRPPKRSTLDGIAERIVALPDTVAVTDARGALSYRGLDALAARIAAGLARFGPRAEDRIGVLVDRSALLPAALLGVWRAGCAYVPLDPAYPAERLAFMLRDSGAVALLADRDPAAVVPEWEGPVVRLDRALADPETAPVPTLDPATLAYVLYTSGSTGLPKGVGVPHGALYNFLAGMAAELGFGSRDRLLAVTSPSFDIAGLEIYLPLLEGGSVAVADRESVLDGEWLREDWERTRATWLQGTPGIWSGLLAAGWPGARAGRALCGGEAMPAALAVSLAARAEAAWNLYGPTETTVWSTAWRLDRSAHVSVPIGTPIANTTVRVLDDALRAVPMGVFGELVLGGAGVGRGYLGRPARTAEVFVPDPEAEASGSRAYRTGDRARLRPGGVLEYAGRRDHQVKLRGNRIELGEIEAALGAHPAVAQGVVALRSDRPDDPRLVAYVTAPRAAPSADELRRFVADRLPAAMVPSVFVRLDELPRTPNGKVDRRRLPAPEAPSASERLFAPPRNDVERRIAAVWREVLGTGEVGIHDNFFDLGGQSLLLARVHARLRQEEGGENLALVDLFRYPTIAELATLLADGAGGPSESAAPTIEERVSQLRTGAERRRRSRDLRRVAVGEGDE